MSQQDILYLVSMLQAYAENNSNPVLDVLAGEAPVNNRKYPENELHFDTNDWRGFYHCHSSPGKQETEHGHFHLFTAVNDKAERQWTHVAGLSMDFQGQALAWFTVNQWVTSGAWVPANQLAPALNAIAISENMSLLEQWLLAMLSTYKEAITALLKRRDEALIQINEHNPHDAIFQNRDVYLLSSSPIDLKSDLVSLTQAS